MIGLIIGMFFFLTLYGWGRLATSFMGKGVGIYPAFTSAIGLTSIIFVGGLLNLFELVSRNSLNIIMGIGCLSTLYFLRAELKNNLKTISINKLIPWAIILLFLIFLSFTLMPGQSVNIFDDIKFYFISAERMLQLGTNAGDPFDGSNVVSLGAQALLHAFMLAHFDFTYIPALDGTLLLVAAAAIVVDLARWNNVGVAGQVLAALMIFVINPMIVNSSSVYGATFLLLAIFFSFQLVHASASNAYDSWGFFFIGAIAGATVALKSSFGIFFAIFFFSYWVIRQPIVRKKIDLVPLLYIGLGGTVVVGPWILSHVRDYLFINSHLNAPLVEMVERSRANIPTDKFLDFFTLSPTFYGGTFAAYTILIGSILVFGLGAVFCIIRSKKDAPNDNALMVAQSFSFIVSFCIIYNFVVPSKDEALRLTIPLLISIFPFIIIVTTRHLLNNEDHRRNIIGHINVFRKLHIVQYILPVAIIFLFSDAALDRLRWMIEGKTQISFEGGREPPTTTVIDHSFRPTARNWISKLQLKIPEGEAILAWHSLPIYMNYSRNPVYNLMVPGFDNPQFNFPSDKGPLAMASLLKNIGINYVIWEHTGIQILNNVKITWPQNINSKYKFYRKHAISLLRAYENFKFLANNGATIYSEHRMVILDLARIKNK